jgi:hypothetical protein
MQKISELIEVVRMRDVNIITSTHVFSASKPFHAKDNDRYETIHSLFPDAACGGDSFVWGTAEIDENQLGVPASGSRDGITF